MSKNESNDLLQKIQNLLNNKHIDIKQIDYEDLDKNNNDDLGVQFNGKRMFAFLILIKIPETDYHQLIWDYYKRGLFSKKSKNVESIKTLIFSSFAKQIINLINKY